MSQNLINLLQGTLTCIAVTAVTVSIVSIAGVTTPFPNLEGNEIITAIFSLAYLSWREDKEEMIRIRREDKEEMIRIRREDKEEMRLNRLDMAAMRLNMTTTSMISTFISLASAISSVAYTYYSINSK